MRLENQKSIPGKNFGMLFAFNEQSLFLFFQARIEGITEAIAQEVERQGGDR